MLRPLCCAALLSAVRAPRSAERVSIKPGSSLILGRGDLMDAIAAGDREAVTTLLEQDPGIPTYINEVTRGGYPLYLASSRGHTEIVQELLRHGAQVEGPTAATAAENPSPLAVALAYNHSAIALTLIEHGASGRRSLKGVVPLSAALRNGDAAVVRALLR